MIVSIDWKMGRGQRAASTGPWRYQEGNWMRAPTDLSQTSPLALPSPSVFDLLDDETRASLEAELAWFSLPGGQPLFLKGDPSNGLFMVLTGCLGLVIGDVTTDEPAVLIRVGEVVGEYSLLLERPEPANCIAIRDTLLAWLSRESFERLVQRHPRSVLFFASHIIEVATQAFSFRRRLYNVPKTVGMIPLHDGAPVEAIASALVTAVTKSGRRAVLIDGRADKVTPESFKALETHYDLIVYCGNTADPEWNRTCIRESDRILLTALATETPSEQTEYLALTKQLPWRDADLLLVQKCGAARPTAQAEPWLRHFPVPAHYHLRECCEADISRLARYLMGQAIGLVLAGGGARGFAHIGAVKAMRAAGIPIDLVGGTSMGSIVAAGVALEWDDHEMRERMHAAFVVSDPLNDFTLPVVALAKGQKVERLLAEHFGESHAEDLWRPYFSVASNLSTGEIAIMRSGILRQILRASIAIPGLLPPVVVDGNLLVDGGIMNNLPCDIMDAMRRGPVIGVDVSRRQEPERHRDRPKGFFRRNFAPPGYDGPGIVNLLLRSATVGSAVQTRSARDHADLVVDTALGDIEIGDWRSFDRAIERGYEATIERIGEIVRFKNPGFEIARFRP